MPILKGIGFVNGLCIDDLPFWWPKKIPVLGDSGEWVYVFVMMAYVDWFM